MKCAKCDVWQNIINFIKGAQYYILWNDEPHFRVCLYHAREWWFDQALAELHSIILYFSIRNGESDLLKNTSTVIHKWQCIFYETKK